MSRHLVFAPGLLCDEDLFAAQAAILGRSFDIRYVDHRRCATIQGIAEAALKELPERFSLCGLSMGGYVALEMARLAPRRVERLALLDTSAAPDTPGQAQTRLMRLEMVREGRLAEVAQQIWEGHVHPARVRDEALKGRYMRMVARSGPAVFESQTRAIMHRVDSRPSLSRIGCPLLVMVGDHDHVTPVVQARFIADSVQGAEFRILKECGHLSTMERPEEVNQALRSWLG